jgi:hypothetical protein
MHSFIINLGYIVLLINLVLFASRFTKQKKTYKIFTLYLFWLFVVQMSASVGKYYLESNLFISHFYFIGQFVILSLFYLSLFKLDGQKRTIRWGLIIGLSILGIQYYLEPSLFFKFNLFEIFITSFLLTIYAAMHLYNMLTEKKEFYYITIGVLLYLVSSTILFLIGNLTLVLSPKWQFLTWKINAILVVVYQLVILYQWKCNFLKKKDVNSIL